MAKMTEAEATNLLLLAAQLATTLTGLIPTLVGNWQAIKDGLDGENPEELNAKIVGAHSDIQALDAQLQALRS